LTVLAQAETCHPIDIFSISRLIADTKDLDLCKLLIDEYGNNSNAFVRRCLLISIRFIGGNFPATVSDYISKSLDDDNAWVRYDAAWIIKDFGSINDNDFIKLRLIAGKFIEMNLAEIESMEVTDPDLYAAKMAAEAVYACRDTI
jgi:hypothetical protein